MDRAYPGAGDPMMNVAACIPTIGLSPYLGDLLVTLDEEGVETRLYVNSATVPLGVTELAGSWGLDVLHRPSDSIYAEWNHAALWAKELGAYLLLLNDDITMLPGTVRELAGALDRCTDYGLISVGNHQHMITPRGVYQVAHQLGNRRSFLPWCCIVRPEAWQDVDPNYKIWYGDDDLIWKVHDAGWKVGVLEGVGVVHHVSTTSQQLPWVGQAAGEDQQLWTTHHR